MLHDRDRAMTSAVWFPLHSKGCGADYICTPAPIHNADGSESLWCFTRPEAVRRAEAKLGHFPLQHFWGPLAGIQSTAWIVDSAIYAAEKYRPNFFYIYLPHLDYAAQKSGPDSKAAQQAVVDLDAEIGKLVAGFEKAYSEAPLWLVASEYVISPYNDVTYPNRVLREAGLLKVSRDGRRRAPRFRRQQSLGAGRSSVLARLRARLRPDDDQEGRPPVRQATRHRRSLTGEGLAEYGSTTPAAATSCWSPTRIVGRPTTGGSTTPRRRNSPAPSISTASPATTRSSCSSTPHQKHPAQRQPGQRLARRPGQRTGQRGVLLTSEPGVFLGGQLADTQVAELVLKQFADE